MTGPQIGKEPSPPDFKWDEAAVEKLTALWKTALSAAQIGREFTPDIGRNAVIGKAARLGLPARRENAVARAKATNMAKGPKRSAASYHFRPSVEGALKTEPLPEPVLDVPPHRRVRLLDLAPKQCRWFCGEVGQPDAGFCPEKSVDGLSWCASHARLVFAGPRRPFTGPRPGRIMGGMRG